MKGIMIYETPLWGDEEKTVYTQEVNNASYTLSQVGFADITCYLEGTATKGPVTKAKCNKDDAYDFETGALISLMKMCGREKTLKAVEELYSLKEPRGADLDGDVLESKVEYMAKEIKRLNNVSEGFYKFNCRLIDEIDQKNHEIASLKEKTEKLKLDCEKLQHAYNDMIFCGGRQNGKQYTFLVDLFKKIDQKKVDAAYKEAYNTTLPVWQKEALRQAYEIRKESKEKTVWLTSQSFTRDYLDSLLESSKHAIPYTTEWIKPPTKREEMWGKILGASKCPPVEIKVAKQDITTFLRELQDKIPEVIWNGSECLPTELSVPDWFKHDYIYFALFKFDAIENLRICYDEKPFSWISKPVIDYLPPMRWDLFKKGRIIVGVRNNNELEEFRKEVERNTGIKNIPTCPTNLCLFYMFDKDNYKIILNSVTAANIAKINGHKVVYWEDVR